MKNLILSLFISYLAISCSTEEIIPDIDNSNISVATIMRKNYNTTTNTVISSTNFEIVNNKITKATDLNLINSQETISNYTYQSNIITNIITQRNGVLLSEQKFIYDSSNKIIEYKHDSFNSTGQIINSNKHVFNRIQDTIYSTWTRSTNNSSNFSPILSSKIVLDSNNNRTFIEKYDHLNNEYQKIITSYDSNNNIVSENHFTLFQNGNYINTLSNTYTYESAINPLSYIYTNTLGKETAMLLYHLQSNAINEVNVKSISPNSINSFISTFDTNSSFTILNTSNSNNHTFLSDYKTLVSNSVFTRFTYEFSFN